MRNLRFLALYLLCLGTVRAESLDGIGTPLDNRVIAGTEVRFKVALSGAKDNVKIARAKDGSLVFYCQTPRPRHRSSVDAG